MKPRHVLESRDACEIFDRAVRERALAVLTLQSGSDWATFKSRFLERDGHGHFFVLDYEAQDGVGLPPIAPGQYVGVSFRQRSRKILFATIVEAKGHFVLDDQTSIPAVRYRWPESLTELQRRAYYRTPVPPDMLLTATMWPGGIIARELCQKDPSRVLTGHMADLSCGGTFVVLDRQNSPSTAADEVYGVELQLPDQRPPILADARCRGARCENSGAMGIAMQFVGLEMSPDGRVILQRLASCVQRLHRLANAAGRQDSDSRQSSQ